MAKPKNSSLKAGSHTHRRTRRCVEPTVVWQPSTKQAPVQVVIKTILPVPHEEAKRIAEGGYNRLIAEGRPAELARKYKQVFLETLVAS